MKDTLRVLGFFLGYIPAAVIPNSWDRPVIDGLVSLILKLRPQKEPALAKKIATALGRPEEAKELEREARHLYEHVLEGPWARVRSLHRNGWKPHLELEGVERIRTSQEAGKGTILWRMSTGSSLIHKRAIWEAGIDLVHLSTAHHGSWSEAWIAGNGVAPLFRRTEGWYLVDRVLIPNDRAMSRVMKTLLAYLKANAVVSVMGEQAADQMTPASILKKTAYFAHGSPALAWKTGATLLPVYSVREATGRYRVIVDEPIATDRSLKRKEFVTEAIQEFAGRLESVLSAHPGSWSGWHQYLMGRKIFGRAISEPST